MSVIRGTAAVLLGAVGAAMLVAGPIMAVYGVKGRKQIREELAGQKITFPEKAEGLPARAVPYAGQAVTTGTQAMIFSEMMANNVRQAAGGRTYSEVSHDLLVAGGKDEKLTALRQTVFMGETLRSSLMSAYQAWQITSLTMGLGALLTGTGAALIATSAVLASGA